MATEKKRDGVYQRGSVWWIDYHVDGKRYREPTNATSRRGATRKRAERIGEAAGGNFVGPDEKRLRFEDLAEMIVTDYAVNRRSSSKQLLSTLRRLRTHFASARVVNITTDRIRSYILAKREEGYAPATVRKDLAALKRAMNLAVQAGKLSKVPHIPSIEVDNARQGFLTEADVDAVCAEIGPDLAPLVQFAALTGWRRGEVRALRWSQVDFETGTVRLEPGTTKNKQGRTFPFRLLPPLEQLLEDQRRRTREVERSLGVFVPYVFHRNGEPVLSFRRAWKAACARAGLGGWLFHDLRRTAVRNLEKASVPRSVAMKLTGHKTEAVYRRYAIADQRDLERGVEKLAALHQKGGDRRRSSIPLHGTNRHSSGTEPEELAS